MSAILTQTEFGPMLVPPFDFYLSQAMIRRGAYAPAEFETWRPYIRAGDVVIDVGANFGSHSFAFAEQVGQNGLVVAIEPQRDLFWMICGTAALNGTRHLQPVHAACGREAGSVFVPAADYRAPNNFGGVELGQETQGLPVKRVKLDSFNCDPSFVKIDVEGMELDVLEGAVETITRARPVLAVEADREDKTPAVVEFLRAHRFRLWDHRPVLGDLWPNVISINILAIPEERGDLPEPTGAVKPLALTA
jgi:FkbM family methyltransferase